MDCGCEETAVLEFDHVGPKRADVATLLTQRASIARLLDEIERCEIVCANCHRRRTAQRAERFRVTGRPSPSWSPSQLRNHRHVLAVLERNPCVDCGESDPIVLDFDHRGDKRSAVSVMAAWASVATLEQEIAKCEVRCANCHRRKTLAERGSYRLPPIKSGSPP